jgi:hypothetical protein
LFKDEELDLDSFNLLDDNQLEKLGIKMGQRVKIINSRKQSSKTNIDNEKTLQIK